MKLTFIILLRMTCLSLLYNQATDTGIILCAYCELLFAVGLASNSKSQVGAGTPQYMAPELFESKPYNEKVREFPGVSTWFSAKLEDLHFMGG